MDRGTRIVILTRSSESATCFTRTSPPIHVNATRAGVVDRVGTADMFNAGPFANLSAEGPWRKAALAAVRPDLLASAMVFASPAAAVTVFRAGANPPYASELI